MKSIERTISQLEEGVSYREPFHISIACALVAELFGSALCGIQKTEGHIYPKPNDVGGDWREVHEPLYILRNALFHPGAIVGRSHGLNMNSSHVQVLLRFALKEGRSLYGNRMARSLKRADALTEFATAAWSVEKLVALGEFELERLGSAPY